MQSPQVVLLDSCDRILSFCYLLVHMTSCRRTLTRKHTAEHAIFLLLSLLRRPIEMDSVLRNRGLGSPVGATIHGKSILVVGFGELGKETAKLLRGFSPAAVKAFRHGAWADHELELVDEAVRDLHDKPCASVETLTPIGHPSRTAYGHTRTLLIPAPCSILSSHPHSCAGIVRSKNTTLRNHWARAAG